MSDRFLNYLRLERSRLDQELERAKANGQKGHEVAAIDQLRRIVDDQLARWSVELMDDRLAA